MKNKCNTCNKHKEECGCTKSLSTSDLCNTLPDCPNPEKCPETFDAGCVVYMGDTIIDLDIKTGDRMDQVLQKLVLALTNPGCVLPNSTCNAVLGLATTSISSTIINLKWLVAANAISYSVEYRAISSLTWLINPTLAPTITQDYISGLTPGTEYYIRVNTICSSGNCYSVTLKVKTKVI